MPSPFGTLASSRTILAIFFSAIFFDQNYTKLVLTGDEQTKRSALLRRGLRQSVRGQHSPQIPGKSRKVGRSILTGGTACRPVGVAFCWNANKQ